MIRRRLTLVLIVVCIVTGCRHYAYDNSRVRELQAASLVGLPITPIAGLSLDDFFGSRTVLILPKTSVLVQDDTPLGHKEMVVDLGGRATPISEDGYYLTAYHLVRGTIPVMPLPPNGDTGRRGRFTFPKNDANFSFGRVVQNFLPADLALIKFNRKTQVYFNAVSKHLLPGLAVFTGSSIGFTMEDMEDMEEGNVGNGPFKASGVILKVEPIAKMHSAQRITTSIVARGGMSGAPVADSAGNLVGILVGGSWSSVTHQYKSTTVEIVPIHQIVAAIEQDRQSHQFEPDGQANPDFAVLRSVR